MSRHPHLLVVTSTYPRWSGDATPGFVQHFARAVAPAFRGVTVLAPHFPGAPTRERDGQLDVRRYRYWWPESGETIAYEGGALGKLDRGASYVLRLLALLAVQLHHAVWRVARGGPTVVNAHWLVPQGFLAVVASLLTRAPTVVTVHGGDVFALTGPLMSRLKRFTLQRADAVVVNSTATLAACRALVPHVDYHLIPMGVHTDRLRPADRPRRDGPLRVLFVGRLAPEKGADDLIRALAEAPATVARIVGDGPERAGLQRLAAELAVADRVHFDGWVEPEHIADAYHWADVLVGPSIHAPNGWQEALGLVFVEALATATPVIATRTGGIADVVRDGQDGYLVDERAPDQIADRLRHLAAEPERALALGRHARQRMVQEYSWESVAHRYREVLHRVAATARSASGPSRSAA